MPIDPYEAIAGIYDAWSRTVVEDVDFYVAEAVASAGPVVELGVGTGRIAVPTALAGVRVIGVDTSAAMLDVCRRRARAAGVEGLLDLREGDYAAPPVRARPKPAFVRQPDGPARPRAVDSGTARTGGFSTAKPGGASAIRSSMNRLTSWVRPLTCALR